MLPVLFCSAFGVAAAFGQYKAEPAGPPPADVAPAIRAALQQDGTKITNNGAPYIEIWFRKDAPAGGKTEEGQTIPGVPTGALIGVIKFDTKGQDRRGQGIKPGVYTLRYGLIPINGDHQGAAPQRDFALMIPAATDTDLNATPAFEQLVQMSMKASGTPHPAVLSMFKADSDAPGFSKQGESDWVLQTKLGSTPIGITLVGIASA